MILTLITLLCIFFVTIILYVFEIAFKKGEIFDVTKKHLKKGGKLDGYLQEVKENIKYINLLPYKWHYIKSEDSLVLAARLFARENSNKIIILFHGYRSVSENDFASTFKIYYELGYNILLVDQRSHGKSEGIYITFGIKERTDCLKWCEYVDNNFKEIDEIILGGISMGATTVLMASGLSLPIKVKGIIADCGFSSPKEIVTRVASRGYGINAEIILPIVNVLCKCLAKFNIYEYSVKDAMKVNKLPILFIHGTADDFVPSIMSKQNFNDCIAPKKLVLVDCVNHGFASLKDKKEIKNEIKNFISNLR